MSFNEIFAFVIIEYPLTDDPTVESTEELAVKDVASLLKEQYAIITGKRINISINLK